MPLHKHINIHKYIPFPEKSVFRGRNISVEEGRYLRDVSALKMQLRG